MEISLRFLWYSVFQICRSLGFLIAVIHFLNQLRYYDITTWSNIIILTSNFRISRLENVSPVFDSLSSSFALKLRWFELQCRDRLRGSVPARRRQLGPLPGCKDRMSTMFATATFSLAKYLKPKSAICRRNSKSIRVFHTRELLVGTFPHQLHILVVPSRSVHLSSV